MFNPQRKSKLADIYMDQRAFQLHLQKMKDIKSSKSPQLHKYEEDSSHQKYLQKLHHNKREVKERLNSQIYKQNHRLYAKIIQTQTRPQDNPERKIVRKQHFHSHFRNKKQTERIRNDNCGIIYRMLNQTSMVPSLSSMKQQFKQNKRYAKLVRKLPSIIKNQQKIKHNLSMNKFTLSPRSLSPSRQNLISQRSSTQMMNNIETIENTLIDKQ